MNYLSRITDKTIRSMVVAGTIASLVTGLIGMNPAMAQGATLTPFNLTLGNSKPATATNMRFAFTSITALTGDATAADDDAILIIRLPTAGTDPFTIGSLVAGDVTLTGFTSGITVNSLTLSNRGGSAANDTITIGLNMTNGTPAAINQAASAGLVVDLLNNRITTPAKSAAAGTADIYQVSFATQQTSGTDTDNGATQVAINDGTTVSASINTTRSERTRGMAARMAPPFPRCRGRRCTWT
jgi:hypothetical protein